MCCCCCVEAKSQARHSLAEWVDEANAEGVNAGADIALVWAHRRGKGSAGDGYVVTDGATFTRLLRMAGFGNPIEEE